MAVGRGHAEGGGGVLLPAELSGAPAGRPLFAGSAAPPAGTDAAVQQGRHDVPAAGPGAAVSGAAGLHEALSAAATAADHQMEPKVRPALMTPFNCGTPASDNNKRGRSQQSHISLFTRVRTASDSWPGGRTTWFGGSSRFSVSEGCRDGRKVYQRLSRPVGAS